MSLKTRVSHKVSEKWPSLTLLIVLEITEEGKACMQKLFKLITTDSMKGMNALKQVERDRTPGTCSWILQKEELKMLGSAGPRH